MQVVLMVNSECNAKCKHCYLTYKGQRSPKDTMKTAISLQEQGHEVVIAGSEILLDQQYLDSYKQVNQVSLLTNGICLKEKPSLYELIRECGIKNIVFSIHFHIDGSLRCVPEKFVMERIREAKGRNYEVSVTSVLTPSNFSRISDMCDYAAANSIDRIKFLRFLSLGRGEKIRENELSDTQIQKIFADVVEAREKFPKYKLDIKLHGSFGPRPGSRGEKLSRENCYCPAGIDTIAIDPDNNIYGCPFTMRKQAIIGKYTNGRIVINKRLLDGRRDTCIAHRLAGE